MRKYPHYFCCAGLLFSLLALLSGCDQLNSNSIQVNNIHDTILLQGTLALQPFISASADLFTQQYMQVKAKVRGGGSDIQSVVSIDVKGGGSLAGLDAVVAEKADIGMTDLYADPVSYADPDLTDHIVVVIPYVVIVNPGVPLTSLSTKQLVSLFATHTVQNWSALGGPDLPVVTVSVASRNKPTYFQSTVLASNREYGTRIVSDDSSSKIRQIVAQTPGAIGYIPAPYLNPSVKAVAVNGVEASASNIIANKYNFWGYGHLYTLKANDQIISSFLNFMLSSKAQSLARTLGYISVDDMQQLPVSS